MKPKPNNPKDAPRNPARAQLLPGLLPLDELIMILDPASHTPRAIHPTLRLPNASVFTPAATNVVTYPTRIS